MRLQHVSCCSSLCLLMRPWYRQAAASTLMHLRSRARALRSWDLKFLLLNGRIRRARLYMRGWVPVHTCTYTWSSTSNAWLLAINLHRTVELASLRSARLVSLKLRNVGVSTSFDRDVVIGPRGDSMSCCMIMTCTAFAADKADNATLEAPAA